MRERDGLGGSLDGGVYIIASIERVVRDSGLRGKQPETEVCILD